MDFPHLKDTEFPIIDNVNVYKYQNNFDYARWQGKVSFKLINVLWNSDYSDVPYFDSEEARDLWFSEKEGYVGILETLFNNTPKTTIKIPVPYNEAYNYNYLVVDMPLQTSPAEQINFSDEEIRVAKWFYFIEDIRQYAPSTTEIEISVDYWTTFIHQVEIPYLMLERGHAPMVQTDVETYLKNPIMNNEFLLADDFNYSNDTIIQTSNYIPIGNGKKYVLFCAPYSTDDFKYNRFDGTKYSGKSTPPSFSNTNERYGWQFEVNNYAWKYGDSDYTNAETPVSNRIQSGILNGCECFAIEGIYARDFFNEMIKYHVNFIHGIQAVFMLDEKLFQKSEKIEFNGYTLWVADKYIWRENLTFNKAQFGFDSKYSEITKLYTSPYSMLEITDDDGNTFSAKIENCGDLRMHTEVSLIYPFLNYNVLFSGINGIGELDYQWRSVYDSVHNKYVWASDFSKFMMNWNIPTYSLFVSSKNEFAANNFGSIEATRAGAIKDYHNALRVANTNSNNTADSYATKSANVYNLTSTQVSDTADLASTMVANTATAVSAANAVTLQNNACITSITGHNNEKINADAGTMAALSQSTTSTKNDFATYATGQSNAANITCGITNGVASMASGVGGLIDGSAGAAIGGVANGFASIANSVTQASCASSITVASCSTNSSITQATNAANATLANHAVMCNNANATASKDSNTNNTNTNNDSATTQTARNASTNNAIAARDKTTADANALRTQTTETNNADYLQAALVWNEQDNLVQKQKEVEGLYKNASLQAPTTYGKYGGDFMPDAYMRRGVRLNIRTQSKSAIAQAGDAMLRFGYALHRVWDMSNGFHYCKNFTFWKAEDIWINDGSGVANIAIDAIKTILLNGVTVWKDPEKIGTIGIYNNVF